MPDNYDTALMQSLLAGAVGTLLYFFTLGLGDKRLAKMIKFVTILIMINIGAGMVWDIATDTREKIGGIADAISSLGDVFSFLTRLPGGGD